MPWCHELWVWTADVLHMFSGEHWLWSTLAPRCPVPKHTAIHMYISLIELSLSLSLSLSMIEVKEVKRNLEDGIGWSFRLAEPLSSISVPFWMTVAYLKDKMPNAYDYIRVVFFGSPSRFLRCQRGSSIAIRTPRSIDFLWCFDDVWWTSESSTGLNFNGHNYYCATVLMFWC